MKNAVVWFIRFVDKDGWFEDMVFIVDENIPARKIYRRMNRYFGTPFNQKIIRMRKGVSVDKTIEYVFVTSDLHR